ncbi:hypothetical protein KFE25_005653 [Diacronema lutheri]|uniref:Uncharacterized protein n=1 Tax=Diacronema lutheri TaxID=2081491 RepID=A0A8J5XFE3_DIALT|nr:hypothetical protein KFE25_005653 [Diacronema lutheri]
MFMRSEVERCRRLFTVEASHRAAAAGCLKARKHAFKLARHRALVALALALDTRAARGESVVLVNNALETEGVAAGASFDAHPYLRADGTPRARAGKGALALAAGAPLALASAADWACVGCAQMYVGPLLDGAIALVDLRALAPCGCRVGLASFAPPLARAGAAAVIVTDSRLLRDGSVAGRTVFEWSARADLHLDLRIPVLEALDARVAPLLGALGALGARAGAPARAALLGAAMGGAPNAWVCAWRRLGEVLRLVFALAFWHDFEQAAVRFVGFVRLDGRAGSTVPQLVMATEGGLALLRLAWLIDCPLSPHASLPVPLSRLLLSASLPLSNLSLLVLVLYLLAVGLHSGIASVLLSRGAQRVAGATLLVELGLLALLSARAWRAPSDAEPPRAQLALHMAFAVVPPALLSVGAACALARVRRRPAERAGLVDVRFIESVGRRTLIAAASTAAYAGCAAVLCAAPALLDAPPLALGVATCALFLMKLSSGAKVGVFWPGAHRTPIGPMEGLSRLAILAALAALSACNVRRRSRTASHDEGADSSAAGGSVDGSAREGFVDPFGASDGVRGGVLVAGLFSGPSKRPSSNSGGSVATSHAGGAREPRRRAPRARGPRSVDALDVAEAGAAGAHAGPEPAAAAARARRHAGRARGRASGGCDERCASDASASGAASDVTSAATSAASGARRSPGARAHGAPSTVASIVAAVATMPLSPISWRRARDACGRKPPPPPGASPPLPPPPPPPPSRRAPAADDALVEAASEGPAHSASCSGCTAATAAPTSCAHAAHGGARADPRPSALAAPLTAAQLHFAMPRQPSPLSFRPVGAGGNGGRVLPGAPAAATAAAAAAAVAAAADAPRAASGGRESGDSPVAGARPPPCWTPQRLSARAVSARASGESPSVVRPFKSPLHPHLDAPRHGPSPARARPCAGWCADVNANDRVAPARGCAHADADAADANARARPRERRHGARLAAARAQPHAGKSAEGGACDAVVPACASSAGGSVDGDVRAHSDARAAQDGAGPSVGCCCCCRPPARGADAPSAARADSMAAAQPGARVAAPASSVLAAAAAAACGEAPRALAGARSVDDSVHALSPCTPACSLGTSRSSPTPAEPFACVKVDAGVFACVSVDAGVDVAEDADADVAVASSDGAGAARGLQQRRGITAAAKRVASRWWARPVAARADPRTALAAGDSADAQSAAADTPRSARGRARGESVGARRASERGRQPLACVEVLGIAADGRLSSPPRLLPHSPPRFAAAAASRVDSAAELSRRPLQQQRHAPPTAGSPDRRALLDLPPGSPELRSRPGSPDRRAPRRGLASPERALRHPPQQRWPVPPPADAAARAREQPNMGRAAPLCADGEIDASDRRSNVRALGAGCVKRLVAPPPPSSPPATDGAACAARATAAAALAPVTPQRAPRRACEAYLARAAAHGASGEGAHRDDDGDGDGDGNSLRALGRNASPDRSLDEADDGEHSPLVDALSRSGASVGSHARRAWPRSGGARSAARAGASGKSPAGGSTASSSVWGQLSRGGSSMASIGSGASVLSARTGATGPSGISSFSGLSGVSARSAGGASAASALSGASAADSATSGAAGARAARGPGSAAVSIGSCCSSVEALRLLRCRQLHARASQPSVDGTHAQRGEMPLPVPRLLELRDSAHGAGAGSPASSPLGLRARAGSADVLAGRRATDARAAAAGLPPLPPRAERRARADSQPCEGGTIAMSGLGSGACAHAADGRATTVLGTVSSPPLARRGGGGSAAPGVGASSSRFTRVANAAHASPGRSRLPLWPSKAASGTASASTHSRAGSRVGAPSGSRGQRLSLDGLANALEAALRDERSGWRPAAKARACGSTGGPGSSSSTASSRVRARAPAAVSSGPDRELFLGVSLAFILRFIREHNLGADALTRDVGRLVAALTSRSGLSLVAQEYVACREADASLRGRGVGIATVFVSHAQSMRFLRLVDALGEYVDPSGDGHGAQPFEHLADGGGGGAAPPPLSCLSSGSCSPPPRSSGRGATAFGGSAASAAAGGGDACHCRGCTDAAGGEGSLAGSREGRASKDSEAESANVAPPRLSRSCTFGGRCSGGDGGSPPARVLHGARMLARRASLGGSTGAAQQASAAAEIYFWIDIFSVPQSRIMSSIQHIPRLLTSMGAVALVIDPWRQPACLTRMWCLLELLHAFQAKCDVRLTMCYSEAVAFYRALRSEYVEVERSLTTIDARRAEATVEADRTLIYNAIEKAMGFDEFNEQLRARMSQCLAELSTAMVARPRRPTRPGALRPSAPSPARPASEPSAASFSLRAAMRQLAGVREERSSCGASAAALSPTTSPAASPPRRASAAISAAAAAASALLGDRSGRSGRAAARRAAAMQPLPPPPLPPPPPPPAP